MKVLVVSQNRERAPFPVMPVGPALAAEAVAARGHDAELVDLCFARRPEAALGAAIARHRPDLIAIGVRNLDNADAVRPESYVPEAAALVAEARRRTAAPVAVGGAAVACMPREMTEALGADYGLTGDGEAALPALADALALRASLADVPGIVRREEGRMAEGRPAAQGAFGPSHRALRRHVGMRRYVRHGALVPVQSKRGCPHRCTYCTYGQLEGPRYRERDPGEVAAEIREIQSWGFPACEMVDAIFTQPRDYLAELCRALRRAGAAPALSASSVNPGGLTAADLLLMEEAGFRTITISVESAAQPVLDRMKKGFGAAAVRAAAAAVRQTKLRALWVFLLGAAGETRATLRETLAFVDEALRPGDVAYLGFGVRVYPDTELGDELGWPRASLLAPRFYLSPELDPREAREEIAAFRARRPQVVIPFETTSAWEPLFVRTLAALRVKPPYWRFAPKVHVVSSLLSRRTLAAPPAAAFGP